MSTAGLKALECKRILVKISGEALAGDAAAGSIDPAILQRIARELQQVSSAGTQVGVVIGGGNIFRGAMLSGLGVDRVAGDSMGMLATMINGLALRDALQQLGAAVRLVSALPIEGVIEEYDQLRVQSYLDASAIVVFSAGTGNPFFTTDTAACLRAIEIGAQLMLKATKVDGVYDSDPATNPRAQLYTELDYDTAINNQLGVMDATALCLARENQLPLRVFNLNNAGALLRIVQGSQEGTRVEASNRQP